MRVEITSRTRPTGAGLIDWASWTMTPDEWRGVAELELDDVHVEQLRGGELRWFLFRRPDGEHVLVRQFNTFVMILLPWVVWEQLSDGSWYKHCCRSRDEALGVYDALVQHGVTAIFDDVRSPALAA